MSTATSKSGTELFSKYITKYKDQVKFESAEGYYHVDIVADAYNQGFSDGESSGKKDFMAEVMKSKIENFVQKANQVYILTQNLIAFIGKQGFKVDSFYINPFSGCPMVIISVPDEVLLNDSFVEVAYGKILENKTIFSKLFSPSSLDISLVSSDNLDSDLLKEDGFGYKENIKS